jgi:hypothetical protein
VSNPLYWLALAFVVWAAGALVFLILDQHRSGRRLRDIFRDAEELRREAERSQDRLP